MSATSSAGIFTGVAATELSKDGTRDLLPVDETTPEFRDMLFENIVCSGAKQAVYINGLPELPISNIGIKNSVFTADIPGAEVHYAENITFENVKVNGIEL